MEGDFLGWAVAIIAVICVGASKGGLMMIGSLAMPIMATVMNPVAAAGMLLPVYVVSDLFGLIAYRQAFDRRVLAILMPATALGVGVGWLTAARVPEAAVTGIVGIIGFVFALDALLRRRSPALRTARVGPGLFWGALTGFTSFVSHSGAPPFQAYVMPLNLAPRVFAGTATILFAWVNAVKLIPYAALGQLDLGNLRVALILAVPAVASVFAGAWIVRVLPQQLFYRIATWLLLVISIKLIRDAWVALV